MLALRASCVSVRIPLAGVLSARVSAQRPPEMLPAIKCWRSADHRGFRRRAIVDAAQAAFGGSVGSKPMSVVLLAGFLGAGKTTVLEQVLKEKHGFKLGVVVNDLAAVNVDASVLRKTIEASGVESVSLENGCVCCTAVGDLQENVDRLVASQPELDAVIVEMSGVAEPARVKEVLETEGRTSWWHRDTPVSVRTVTVVDSPSFPTDFMKEQVSDSKPKHTSSDFDERFGTLLAEQVECADMILLNKADIATKVELQETQVMINTLNDVADTRITTYGRVQVSDLLGVGAKEPSTTNATGADLAGPTPSQSQSSAQEMSPCCAAKTCSKANLEATESCVDTPAQQERSRADTRFGITSFVYTTDRLMSRAMLVKHLEQWQKSRADLGDRLSLEGLCDGSNLVRDDGGVSASVSSPLSPVLRSKGLVLMDADPDIAFYWSHAGKSVAFTAFGPWPENRPRRTELVFIGAGYDESLIRGMLDSCLLTERDLELLSRILGRSLT